MLRSHLPVAAAVAVATAVITGALLVGDSVRGSLRDLVTERLGRVDAVLQLPARTEASLATQLNIQAAFSTATCLPAILQSGAIEASGGMTGGRAIPTAVIGVPQEFWELGPGGPPHPLKPRQLAITQNLARELQLKVGSDVLLRLPRATAVPADSLLGEKTDRVVDGRFTVNAILAPRGLARFGLTPSQHPPRNVFVRLSDLQAVRGDGDTINTILIANHNGEGLPDSTIEAMNRAVDDALTLEQLGIQSRTLEAGRFQFFSAAMVFPPAVVAAAKRAFGEDEFQPSVTYLANTIAHGGRSIPYSMVCGIDSTARLGPLFNAAGEPIRLADDEIVLNDWAAEDLGVRIGDQVTLTYYDPESAYGKPKTQPPVTFTLKAIVPLARPDGRPASAADPLLTPEVEGVTDQDTIDSWQVFDLVEEVRPKDDQYWRDHRATPKAFISFERARSLWLSRWGAVTIIRVGAADATLAEVTGRFRRQLTAKDVGIAILPVKQLGLAAATGTTPFEGLFIGFSLFLIVAATSLILLLFRLDVENRSKEVGLLIAVGMSRRRLTRRLASEGFRVAAVGGLIGAIGGIGYAGLMLWGLTTLWVAAIGTPFLRLHVTPTGLIGGWIIGVLVSQLAIYGAVRQAARTDPRRLLAGRVADDPATGASGRWSAWTMWGSAAAAVATAFAAARLSGDTQALTFFAAGSLALVAGLTAAWRWCRATRRDEAQGRWSLLRLATQNAARKPGRSVLTLGLVAAATFLIVALSAFRIADTDEGTGNFELLAETELPVIQSLQDVAGQVDIGFSDDAIDRLRGVRIVSFRVREGEDASCLNLYQTSAPTVLGGPLELPQHNRFAWAATRTAVPEGSSTWTHVLTPADSSPIPVAIDANTATYSLKLSGVGTELALPGDAAANGRVSGLLKNSVLQGMLIVPAADFERIYPDRSGYQYFLIDTSDCPTSLQEVTAILETTLADYGMDVTPTAVRLRELLNVQNTYIFTFQTLGGLGLLLGTLGLAAVQVRSVLERRQEMALMRATGFSRRRLTTLVFLENLTLLLGGLALGVAAAAVAVVPHWLLAEASIPWLAIGLLLIAVAVFGAIAGLWAVRIVLRQTIATALAGD